MSVPTISEVKVEEPDEIEQPHPERGVTREIKEEPVEEPIDQELVEAEQSGYSVVEKISTDLVTRMFQ